MHREFLLYHVNEQFTTVNASFILYIKLQLYFIHKRNLNIRIFEENLICYLTKVTVLKAFK